MPCSIIKPFGRYLKADINTLCLVEILSLGFVLSWIFRRLWQSKYLLGFQQIRNLNSPLCLRSSNFARFVGGSMGMCVMSAIRIWIKKGNQRKGWTFQSLITEVRKLMDLQKNQCKNQRWIIMGSNTGHCVTPRSRGYGDVTATYIRRSEIPSRI